MLHVGPEPIDAPALLTTFTAGLAASGGVVSFTGVVRSEGGSVDALELEHYPGFTEARIAEQMAQAERLFGLEASCVVHRVGRMRAGDGVVFVSAAAAHLRPAFNAVDHLMDYLKSAAPFWKKEHAAGGVRWIEPRPEDHADLSRWVRLAAAE